MFSGGILRNITHGNDIFDPETEISTYVKSRIAVEFEF